MKMEVEEEEEERCQERQHETFNMFHGDSERETTRRGRRD